MSSDLSFNNAEGYSRTLLWQGEGGLHQVYWQEFLYTLSLAKVLWVYFLLEGISWNRTQLLNRQGLRQWVCLLETVTLDIRYQDSVVIAEARVMKL